MEEEFKDRKIVDIQSIETSKAFCIKPWLHLFISHFGTVAPCCLAPWDDAQAFGNINEQSVEEIWNGKKMRDFRVRMLKDEPDSRCRQCYESESVGLHSSRITTNFLYADKLDWVLGTSGEGHVSDAKPVYWDIRFSNLCNFKCRICGHHSSSQWYEDAKALGLVSHDTKLHRGPRDFGKLLKQLEFVTPYLEEIYFAGGEPLIMEEHYFILNNLLRNGKKNVRLRYATNFSQTIYKQEDAFQLWKQFEDVFVYASLDGMGQRGELQRNGQSWAQAVENRRRMMEVCPETGFLVSSTMSIFNIFHLPDFHREWVESKLIGIEEFMPHLLKYPAEYSIRVLPEKLKAQVEDKMNSHIEWVIDFARKNTLKPPSTQVLSRIKGRDLPKSVSSTNHPVLDYALNEFRSSITFMNSQDDSHLLSKFKEMCDALDKLRGENTREVFPELKEIWD